MRKHLIALGSLFAAVLSPVSLRAQSNLPHAQWRSATANELAQAIPARAPVEKERIETELRTASGIVDRHDHMIAGVVLITAGYSADGKYSHYLMVGSNLEVGGIRLKPGRYVFGWKRVTDGLDVHFYEAATGQERGSTLARQLPPGTRVEAFHMTAPGDHAFLQIGRFGLPYAVSE